MVTVREDGRERRITAAEAFLLQLTRKGLSGDNAAARASLEAIEKARASRGEDLPVVSKIIINVVGDGVDAVIGTLGITHRKYPTDEARVRWELNPWIVEAALARFGTRKLTVEEQREVWNNPRTAQKVSWPEWWTEKA